MYVFFKVYLCEKINGNNKYIFIPYTTTVEQSTKTFWIWFKCTVNEKLDPSPVIPVSLKIFLNERCHEIFVITGLEVLRRWFNWPKIDVIKKSNHSFFAGPTRIISCH